MRKKMANEMDKAAEIDAAFKVIKTETGVTDVQEMVNKFMTREGYYSSLLQTVSQSDQRIDKLKKENEHLDERLNQLRMDSSSSSTSASGGVS